MGVLTGELHYAMANLVAEDGTRPYFMSYTVYEEHTALLGSDFGGLLRGTLVTISAA